MFVPIIIIGRRTQTLTHHISHHFIPKWKNRLNDINKKKHVQNKKTRFTPFIYLCSINVASNGFLAAKRMIHISRFDAHAFFFISSNYFQSHKTRNHATKSATNTNHKVQLTLFPQHRHQNNTTNNKYRPKADPKSEPKEIESEKEREKYV